MEAATAIIFNYITTCNFVHMSPHFLKEFEKCYFVVLFDSETGWVAAVGKDLQELWYIIRYYPNSKQFVKLQTTEIVRNILSFSNDVGLYFDIWSLLMELRVMPWP